MKIRTVIAIASASISCAVATTAQTEAINLRTSPGAILSKQQRQAVLEVGSTLLSREDSGFLERLRQSEDPFRFAQRQPKPPDDPGGGTEPDETPAFRTDFSDREILGMVAPQLQKVITGSMIMGERKILLRTNGKPIEVGYAFKTRVSPDAPTSHTITITDIQPKSFSIQLNQTEIIVPIGEPLSSGITSGG